MSADIEVRHRSLRKKMNEREESGNSSQRSLLSADNGGLRESILGVRSSERGSFSDFRRFRRFLCRASLYFSRYRFRRREVLLQQDARSAFARLRLKRKRIFAHHPRSMYDCGGGCFGWRWGKLYRGGWVVVEWRRFGVSASTSGSAEQRPDERQVVEHDIDMMRGRPQELTFSSRVVQLIRWLAPASQPTVSPMRSVAREIEEQWPSRDR